MLDARFALERLLSPLMITVMTLIRIYIYDLIYMYGM